MDQMSTIDNEIKHIWILWIETWHWIVVALAHALVTVTFILIILDSVVVNDMQTTSTFKMSRF